MYARLRDMKRLGIPVLMSEFGGDKVVRQFVEDHLQSFFWWQYKDFGKGWGSSGPLTFTKSKEEGGLGLINPDGELNEPEIPNVARTTLHSTAGVLLKSTYRVETGHFNAMYEATPGGTSVLFFSKNRLYKNGYTLDVTPRGSIIVKENGNYVDITYTGSEPTLVVINL
jgi:hypothetical protein